MIAAGRLDDNGSLDLVVGNGGASGAGPINVAVLLNTGDGFSPPEGPPLPATATIDLVLEDFDEDGELDIATDGVFLGSGWATGRFGPAPASPTRAARRIVPGDIDGDGAPRPARVELEGATGPTCCVGTGGGGFHIGRRRPCRRPANFRPVGFAIGRFNADPRPT